MGLGYKCWQWSHALTDCPKQVFLLIKHLPLNSMPDSTTDQNMETRKQNKTSLALWKIENSSIVSVRIAQREINLYGKV
jgi:hypothetical protein